MKSTSPADNLHQTEALIEHLFKAPLHRTVLPNGLTLVHRPDFSSAVISVQVWVKTGSIHEGALTGSGVSHYLEHLLFKGTATREGASISRTVHAMGGHINAYTTFDRTVYYIDAPAHALGGAVELLADMVLNSTLPELEVARERDVILREIDMGLDDPDQQLSQLMFQTAFQKHPYREPVIGHRALYEQLTREELLAYYRARYVPNNMVVSIAGAVDAESTQQVVEQHFAGAPRGSLAPVLQEPEPEQLAPRHQKISGEYNVVRGGLGFKVPNLSDPDAPHLDALAYALGGGESSLLWARLRNEQNLVHYIDCRNWNPGSRGLLWISYLCDPGKGAEVEAAIWECIGTIIATGIDDAVVDKARRQSLAAEINGRKTMSGQAARLGMGEVVVGDLHYSRRYLQRLQAITAADLQQAAARYLVQAGVSTVRLGPEEPEPCVAGSVPQFGAAAKFERVDLAGELPLLVQVDESLPLVHLRCVLLGGPMYEPALQRGISSLLAELLVKDTSKHSAAQIAERIEGIGGKMSASGGNNTINLSIEVLPESIDLAIDLLADALLCPAFVEATFETERDAQVAGLKEDDDDILEFGFRKLRERFFGVHPFAVGAAGRAKDLEALELESVRQHYQQLVRRGNIVISACGDLDQQGLVEKLNQSLASKLGDQRFDKIAQPVFAAPTAVDGVEYMDREQAVVLQGFPDVGIVDDDFVVGEVLNELLSGMSSRLFERVRDEKGLAYYVGATRVLGLGTSMFVLYAGTHPDHAEAVIQEMHAELTRIAEGAVHADELTRCRTRLKAARVMGRQTIGSRAMHAAINWTYGLPIDDDADYAAKLDACDVSRLQRFVQERLNPQHRVQLVVRPPLAR